jgi:hypothetical protein
MVVVNFYGAFGGFNNIPFLILNFGELVNLGYALLVAEITFLSFNEAPLGFLNFNFVFLLDHSASIWVLHFEGFSDLYFVVGIDVGLMLGRFALRLLLSFQDVGLDLEDNAGGTGNHL